MIDWQYIVLQLSIGIASTVIGLMIKNYFRKANEYRKRSERKMDDMNMKIEAIIAGLRNVNHGFGEQFSEEYDNHYQQALASKKFIENQNN